MSSKSQVATCDECQRPLRLGEDVVQIEKGVWGPRGFVPLGEISWFCSEECIGDQFGVPDNEASTADRVERLPRRVP